MTEEIYITKEAIIKLTDDELDRRIQILSRQTRESMNASKTTDRVWYKSLNQQLGIWEDALNQKVLDLDEIAKKSPYRPNPKILEDRQKRVKNLRKLVQDLAVDYKNFQFESNVESDLDTGDPQIFSDKARSYCKVRFVYY